MIYSAGIIPFRINSDTHKMEFFVGRPGGNRHRHYYAFLKGHVEEGENWEEAAIREFQEESGVQCPRRMRLIPLGSTLQNTEKVVVAYGWNYPNIEPSECYSNMATNCSWPEIDDYKWLSYDVLKKHTHPSHLKFYNALMEIFHGYYDS